MQYLKMCKASTLLVLDPVLGRDPWDTRKLYHRRKLHTPLYLGIAALVKQWGYSKPYLLMCKVTKCLVKVVGSVVGLVVGLVKGLRHQGNKVSKHKSFLVDRLVGHLHRHRRSCRRLDILHG